MPEITLYHNADCSKSRAVEAILNEAKADYAVVEYLKTPPSVETLDSLLKKLRREPVDLVRAGEDEFETLGLAANPPTTREAWLRILHEHPILIERPIVADGTSAVVGRPPVNVKTWLAGRKP